MKYKHKKTGKTIELDDYEEAPFELDGKEMQPDENVFIVNNITHLLSVKKVRELKKNSTEAWFADFGPAVKYSLQYNRDTEFLKSLYEASKKA